eukprot:scaffold110026_cov21-Tisochrysis_lutea.AAC.1
MGAGSSGGCVAAGMLACMPSWLWCTGRCCCSCTSEVICGSCDPACQLSTACGESGPCTIRTASAAGAVVVVVMAAGACPEAPAATMPLVKEELLLLLLLPPLCMELDKEWCLMGLAGGDATGLMCACRGAAPPTPAPPSPAWHGRPCA